jgi:hypothetical protein
MRLLDVREEEVMNNSLSFWNHLWTAVQTNGCGSDPFLSPSHVQVSFPDVQGSLGAFVTLPESQRFKGRLCYGRKSNGVATTVFLRPGKAAVQGMWWCLSYCSISDITGWRHRWGCFWSLLCIVKNRILPKSPILIPPLFFYKLMRFGYELLIKKSEILIIWVKQ